MRYTIEKRNHVLTMRKNGISVAQIALDTAVPKSTIYSWLSKAEKNSTYPTKEHYTYADYCNLIRRYEKAEAIINVLKSVRCNNYSSTQEKLYALEELYGKYSVHTLCDALDIPRGTFYNHVLLRKENMQK